MALTDVTVRQARATGKDYTLTDFDGLSLAVSAAGGKSWHFRYYWATKSLTENDLNYKSSEDARSTIQIIEHIYSLTIMISSSFEKKEFKFTSVTYNYNELRTKTLLKLKYIHNELRSNPDFSQLFIKFERGGTKMEFPFWNQINGPISDALWHCGQVVMNRRSSDNPLQSGVNVFLGKTSKQ